MFNGQFVSVTSGKSKSTGNSFYKVELIAQTTSGNAKIYSNFCTERAYASASTLKPMQPVTVQCGVGDNGYLTVDFIKARERE